MRALSATLAGRMVFSFVGIIAVATLVLAGVVPGLARGHQLSTLEDRLADDARLIADYAVTELTRQPDADLDRLAKRLGQGSKTRITIISPDGTVLGESHQDLSQVGNHLNRPEVQAALGGRLGVDWHHSETVGYDMLYVAVPIGQNGDIVGVARTALPLSEVDRLVKDQTRAILLNALGGSLFAVLIAILAARAITKPLGRLTRIARALADDPTRAAHFHRATGPTEVVQLDEALQVLATATRDGLQRVGAERDRLDAVLANLADGIVMIDAGGRVARLNAAAEGLLSIHLPIARGRTVTEVLRDHELIDLVQRVALSEEATPRAHTFLEWRHPRRFLKATVSRFGLAEASQTLLVLQDLSEIRRLETVRRDFIANVSHELRTPIASIKIMTETLQDGAVDDPEVARDFLGRIAQEVDGLHLMVEELLELVRLESGRVDVVLGATDAEALVRTAAARLGAMAERAGVSLSDQLPPDLPPVLADPVRMGQVLVNLIHNGIKFTPRGGSVVVRAAEEGSLVRLSVADTGGGIAPELLSRIFERFYKVDKARADGGTGLGLAIAKHTVQLHSGTIWAESEGAGRGTTVHVTLPIAPAELSHTGSAGGTK